MTHPWHDLSPGRTPPDRLNVVVETPRGSRNRFELDRRSGLFRLERVLPEPTTFGCEYGFVPRTYALDGDPLDAVVLVSAGTMTGCLIEARPIAVLRLRDGEQADDKVILVPWSDPAYADHLDLGDVSDRFLREFQDFLSIYRYGEPGRVESLGWQGASAARSVIIDAIARYGVRELHSRIEEVTEDRPPRTLEL